MKDPVTLIGKENDDGVKQSDEREGGEHRQKFLGEKISSCQ